MSQTAPFADDRLPGGLRTGSQFLAAIAGDGRRVFVDGEEVNTAGLHLDSLAADHEVLVEDEEAVDASGPRKGREGRPRLGGQERPRLILARAERHGHGSRALLHTR